MYFGGLCFITDRSICKLSYVEMVRQALEAGATWLQYRDKEGSGREIFCNASDLRRITRDYHAVFIVNDRADIALAVEADGVHLGQDDLPVNQARKLLGRERLIGLSTHTIRQAADAETSGADYIGFGPVFETRTKDAGSPKGIQMLLRLRKKVKIPIVAIGGITPENVRSVLDTGVDAVAVSSAILAGNIPSNIKAFHEHIAAY